MGNLTIFLLILVFVAAGLPAGSNAALYCPNGFELHGQRCYKALNLYASWPEAKEYCKILGAKLAAIASDYEQTIISGIMFKLHGTFGYEVYWLDGSDMLVEKEWRWMGDNGASVPFSFTYWAAGHPANTKERCLEIRYDWGSKWRNAHCHGISSVICEARASSTRRQIINDTMQDP
ncbi:hypothetical protein ACJMK2_001730 [Sinanodonta woodiana]|uniref:C-type lectin domain-containing protein n=1 Tax=Sinanodonta woodiana TaxID=1069815 RepID=A0ABD3XT52_SINWO